MKFQLEHVAIHCKNLDESIKFYEKYYSAKPTAIRKGSAGYGFCFMVIDGAPAVQLMESAGEPGVHHELDAAPVVDEHVPVAVEDRTARRGDAERPHLVVLRRRQVLVAGDHLEGPEP
jgi:catechol 2,3-dioxygenase-like lactoylglutathione lyase family enzyme